MPATRAGSEEMNYTARGTAVWFGVEPVCTASTDNYAQAIAEALNEWQGK